MLPRGSSRAARRPRTHRRPHRRQRSPQERKGLGLEPRAHRACALGQYMLRGASASQPASASLAGVVLVRVPSPGGLNSVELVESKLVWSLHSRGRRDPAAVGQRGQFGSDKLK